MTRHTFENDARPSFIVREIYVALARCLPVLIVLGAANAHAADVDFSEWTCESCPFDSGYRAEYSAGGAYVSDDAARFGNATGYDENGLYALLDGNGIYTSEDHRLIWSVENLGLDARRGELEGGRPGNYGYYVHYSQLPHLLFDTTSTIFTAAGNSVLNEPAGWIDSGLTSGFTALSDSLQPRPIANERQKLELGGDYRPFELPFDFTADYRHEERTGNRIIGGSFYTQSALLPTAVDYQTDDVDLGASYVGPRGQLRLGYRAGWFRNNAWSVTWDNPFAAPAEASRGRLAQAPDNQYQQVSASGAYRLNAYDTVLSASTVFGQIDQRDSLLPYSINPLLGGRELPRDRLNGSVDTTHVALSVSSRPHRRARIRARYTYDERDNQTPVDQWQGVLVDSFDSGALLANVPFSYDRSKLNVRATVDVIDRLKLVGGYERTQTDRDFQEVAEQTEDDSWVQLKWRPRPLWHIRLKGGTAKRTVDRYDSNVPLAANQNPLLRKYNLAYRFREYGSLSASATLPDSPVTLSTTARIANDSYSQSLLGLRSNDEFSYSADLNWTVSDNTTVYINGGWDEMEAEQTGSELFGEPDWRATHEDEFFTGSAGITVRDLSENLDLMLDYTHAVGDSTITVDSLNSGPSPFPRLESNRDSLRLRLVYDHSNRLTTTAQLVYEDFSTTDWALVAPDTIPNVLTLGADPYNYSVFLIGVQFTYSIGAREISLPD